MHLPKLSRRRVMAVSATVALAGASVVDATSARAQDSTPTADSGGDAGPSPSTVEQQIANLASDESVTWPAPVATTFYVQSDFGRVAQFDETANKSCIESGLVVVSGTNRTNTDGTVTFRVMEYACLDLNWQLMNPATVHVTPRETSPSLVTARTDIDVTDNDVVISVYSWDLSGQALPNVWFHWTCIAAGDVPV